MEQSMLVEQLDQIIQRLRGANWKAREAIKDELLMLAKSAKNQSARLGDVVIDHLEANKKNVSLEVRWELEEVIEALQPEPEPEPEEPEEEEEEDPNRPLQASDLQVVYDDPRGLVLYKAKKADRWFATQVDPMTGQPKMFELHPQEVQHLKKQLAGSPYWVIGAGAGSTQ